MTYEQIITRFEWWADAHPMIRSFTHGNLELADLDKEKDFPAIHIQPLAFPIGVHTLTYRFEVYVFELHREDSGEAREIKVDLSDTLQIFGDLVAEIRNGFEAFDREDFLLQYPIEPTPFIQEFNGVYTGVQGSLAIETAFLANACESPVNVADAPSQFCPVGTVTLNGVTFGTVASGGTLDVPVVNSASTQIGTVNAGTNVTIGDATVLLNGSAYGSVVAEGTIDVIAATASVGATLLQTGQTISYATGDDPSRGRLTDFFTLASNNPFGHTFRFTGYLGGYSNDPLNIASPDYRLVNGTASNLAGAFPEDVVIDWSTYDGTTVLGYYRPMILGTDVWLNALAACAAYSTVSYPSGWKLINKREIQNIENSDLVGALLYAPFSLASNPNIQTATTYGGITAQVHLWFNSGSMSTVPKTTARGYSPIRYFTVTGTTLT